MTAIEILNSIKPGKNYPCRVEITEEVEGNKQTVTFLLQSYFVGMYAAIYFPGDSMPVQTGDHDNRKFVRSFKQDIQKAIDRGASVEFGSILPVKTEHDPI